MKNWLKLCLLFGILIFYVIVINMFAIIISFPFGSLTTTERIGGGSIVEVNMGESLDVEITRPRFYGTIYETSGDTYLSLFNIFLFPTKIKGYNFLLFHFIFIISMILLTILMFTKKNSYKEVTKNEQLGETSNNTGNFLSSIHN